MRVEIDVHEIRFEYRMLCFSTTIYQQKKDYQQHHICYHANNFLFTFKEM